MTRQPGDGAIVITGEASAAASMFLDMAAYLGGPGLDGFVGWVQERYPGVTAQQVSQMMNGMVTKLSNVLFSAT